MQRLLTALVLIGIVGISCTTNQPLPTPAAPQTTTISTTVAATDTPPSEFAAAYRREGEKLYAARSPGVAWLDGSNWTDGISDRPPSLPIEPGAPIGSGVTCAQEEIIQMTAFPAGEDPMTWHMEADADAIGSLWTLNKATAIWGEHPEALDWLDREPFSQRCGSLMQ